jgi:hypothetical protein
LNFIACILFLPQAPQALALTAGLVLLEKDCEFNKRFELTQENAYVPVSVRIFLCDFLAA